MLTNVSDYAECEKPSLLHPCGQFDWGGGARAYPSCDDRH